ncbi:eCIS core domain-containing protein [Nostoc sp.]|uniref:eCIS core domain-containing protein n=1 Tax=Nostoc sp. TaxID=1180 RepID=UPI002FFAE31D
MREHISRQKKTTTGFSIPSLKHPIRGFGLESSTISRQAVPEIQPIHKPVTHDISRIPLRTQAKLSISQPGDIYEQEADSVAQQVMQTMAQPVNRQSIQQEALPEEKEEELQMKPLDISTLQRQEALLEEEEEEEELQMKPLDNSTLQREEVPEDEEELQMKSLDNSTLQREEVPEDEEELQMKSMVQRQAQTGMAAAPDLETSINQARGGGVAMADNIRQPMEEAFGADFSGVKVHTDGQSDQLNRSIQARAFTTGQDVFFRSGEYNPGSRGGQELLAHELTHVVQQSGGAAGMVKDPNVTKGSRETMRVEQPNKGGRSVQETQPGVGIQLAPSSDRIQYGEWFSEKFLKDHVFHGDYQSAMKVAKRRAGQVPRSTLITQKGVQQIISEIKAQVAQGNLEGIFTTEANITYAECEYNSRNEPKDPKIKSGRLNYGFRNNRVHHLDGMEVD